MAELSIIIVNYRVWKRLSDCLDSLNVIEDQRFSFEVIIVDNNSDDGKLEKFRLSYPKFNFLSNSGNNGFANGCNLGAGSTNGELLLFLNPDTVVSADAIFGMIDEARFRQEFSIISCRQVKENGSEDRPYGRFLTPVNLTGWLRALARIFFGQNEKMFPQNNKFIYPDWISGSVVMLKRTSYNAIGGWDDDFWMYFEDVDLCRRAFLKNGEIVLLKTVSVEHNHGGSSRINKHVTALTKTEVNISRHIYISKHEKGWRKYYMHTFLILNNILLGFIPALAGTLLFFNSSLNITARIYFQLVAYYVNVLKTGTWLSKRSVNYLSNLQKHN